jgi:hypothetical protein
MIISDRPIIFSINAQAGIKLYDKKKTREQQSS